MAHADPAEAMSQHPMLINGELVQAEGNCTAPVINPATGKEFDAVPDASRGDVDKAVAAARAAFPGWRAKPFAERAECLKRFSEALKARVDEFAKALTSEQGKPLGMAKWEVGATAGKVLKWTTAEAAELVPEEYERNEKGRCEVHFHPRGVVVGITPWNFPLLMAANKLFPAVITGNTIVLKPSPFTPLSTVMLASIAKDCFPAGVMNIITGGNGVGQMLVEHPDVKMVAFTGSSATGKKIMATCSSSLKRATLELGGNDPCIILPGSDVKDFAPKVFQKAMFNTGQVCTAIKRLYVHDSQYEEMVSALAALAVGAKLGDGMAEGTQYGPLNNKMQLERVEGLVEEARKSGARIAAGGGRAQPTGVAEAYFYKPTIIADISDDQRIVQEEQFGPALPVLKYTEVADAVSRANATNMGLGASVWGADVQKAADVATQLEAGSIWINAHLGSGLDIDAPFAGIKESGVGQEGGGKIHLKEYVDAKCVYIPNA